MKKVIAAWEKYCDEIRRIRNINMTPSKSFKELADKIDKGLKSLNYTYDRNVYIFITNPDKIMAEAKRDLKFIGEVKNDFARLTSRRYDKTNKDFKYLHYFFNKFCPYYEMSLLRDMHYSKGTKKWGRRNKLSGARYVNWLLARNRASIENKVEKE